MCRYYDPMQPSPRRRIPATIALLLSGALALSACSAESDPDAPGAGQSEAASPASAYKDGCPTADLLEPVLSADGSPPFGFDGSGPHRDTGWFCRYVPGARNPMGFRLDVYYRNPQSPGKPERASGPYALPEFGPAAYLNTSCDEDGGEDRLSVHFARKGEDYNSQEIVFMTAGDLVHDCDLQVEVMRALTKLFYDNPIGEES